MPSRFSNRRRFLRSSIGLAATMTLPSPAFARSKTTGKLRIGVITDVHQDVMHDGMKRLAGFLDAMRREKVDLIVQLGDFCKPTPANKPFIDLWNSFEGPRHHVIGNHDTDGGFKREQTAAYYGMPGRYYSFDQGGIHFIILDGNDPGGTKGGYNRFIAADQKAWLENELSTTRLPVIVMVHQPLDSPGGIVNQEEIRAILEKDRGPEHPGVAAVLTGHLHQNYMRSINDISHIQINSASYVWLPAKARRNVYDEAAHKAYPYLDHVAPYRDPLWAVVTLDHDAGTLAVKGRASEWVGPDPWARGAPEADYPRELTSPAISDWAGTIRNS